MGRLIVRMRHLQGLLSLLRDLGSAGRLFRIPVSEHLPETEIRRHRGEQDRMIPARADKKACPVFFASASRFSCPGTPYFL